MLIFQISFRIKLLSFDGCIKVDSKLKAIDVMHLGWNIGKALGKRRSYTAKFIKKVFADTMKENEINTIIKKMSHSETECLIKLNPDIIQ